MLVCIWMSGRYLPYWTSDPELLEPLINTCRMEYMTTGQLPHRNAVGEIVGTDGATRFLFSSSTRPAQRDLAHRYPKTCKESPSSIGSGQGLPTPGFFVERMSPSSVGSLGNIGLSLLIPNDGKRIDDGAVQPAGSLWRRPVRRLAQDAQRAECARTAGYHENHGECDGQGDADACCDASGIHRRMRVGNCGIRRCASHLVNLMAMPVEVKTSIMSEIWNWLVLVRL